MFSQNENGEDDLTSRRCWVVWRQDDNGNRFVVEANLTRERAQALAAELESHGHKQLYWIARNNQTT